MPYLKQLLDKFNISSEDMCFTSHIRKQDAWLMIDNNPGYFNFPVIIHPNAVLGECHAVAAHLALHNPTWKLCFGLAEWGECVTEWGMHSWCIDDKNQIIEPTTLIRNRYIGVVIPENFKSSLIWEELSNIQRVLGVDDFELFKNTLSN